MMHGDSRVMVVVFWRQPVYQHPSVNFHFPRSREEPLL